MLSTWLHKEAIASRNACVTEAQERLHAVVRTREAKAKAVKNQLSQDKDTWQAIVSSIKAL
jgi:hypothetical protein